MMYRRYFRTYRITNQSWFAKRFLLHEECGHPGGEVSQDEYERGVTLLDNEELLPGESPIFKKYGRTPTGVLNDLAYRPMYGNRWIPSQSLFGGPRAGKRPCGDNKHCGIDLWAPYNTPVKAPRSGVVEYFPAKVGWGRTVYLYFKLETKMHVLIFAHLLKKDGPGWSRRKEDNIGKVSAGEIIARTGCSGNANVTYMICGKTKGCRKKNSCGWTSDHVHIELQELKPSNPADRWKDPAILLDGTPQFANDRRDICCKNGKWIRR